MKTRAAIVLLSGLLVYIALLCSMEGQFPVWWPRSLGLVIPAAVCFGWLSVRSKSAEYIVLAMGSLLWGMGSVLRHLDRDGLAEVLNVMAAVFIFTAAIKLCIGRGRKNALGSSN